MQSYSEKYQQPFNISANITNPTNPQIIVSGNSIYTIWIGLGTGVVEQSDIYYRKSSDGGNTFGNILNLSNDPGSSFNPHIEVSGKHVYVVWQDGTGETGNTHILFRRSSDGGNTFDRTVAIGKYFGISSRPEIFATGNSVFLLWQDVKPSPEQIFYSRSVDFGRSFSFPITISKGTDQDSINAQVYAQNNTKKVYVVWTEGNFSEGRTAIIYRASSDGGGTFARPIILSTQGRFATNPKMTTDVSYVYTLWKEGIYDKGEIMFRRSSDDGTTFDRTLALSSKANSSSDSVLFAYRSHVYTAWTFDTPNGYKEIVFRSSRDSGKTFAQSMILNNKLINSSHPEISGSNDSVYVIWESRNGTKSDIVIRKSIDGGITFDNPVNVNTGQASSNPAIAVYRNKAYIIWEDNLPGLQNVLFREEI